MPDSDDLFSLREVYNLFAKVELELSASAQPTGLSPLQPVTNGEPRISVLEESVDLEDLYLAYSVSEDLCVELAQIRVISKRAEIVIAGALAKIKQLEPSND